MTGSPLPARALGRLAVPAIGYGAMVLSNVYADGEHSLPDDAADAALAAAVGAGCTFVDTSDSYRDNEEVIGRFLRESRRDEIVISTKFGLRLGRDVPARELPVPWTGGSFRVNAAAARVRGYLEASLERLGTDHVDLYSPHFPDPGVPIEATVEAMAGCAQEGLVHHLGLSNAGIEHLRRAQSVHPIAAVQVEWSMWHPIDPDLLDRCETTGTGIVAWSPLGRGFLAGGLTPVGRGDFRSRVERLTGANLAENNERYAPVVALAVELGITPAQLALAWLLHRSRHVVPIPGSRNPRRIAENAAAARITLDTGMLVRVASAVDAFHPAGDVS